jgi:excisionase family DNA binding protein
MGNPSKNPSRTGAVPDAAAPRRGEYMTLPEVAAALQCSRKQVERFIASGELIATRFGARMVRVHRRDFEAFCALRRQV